MVAPRSGSEGVIDHTHDPAAGCWVPGASEHADFPLQNLPLGVFSMGSNNAGIAVAIGDWIVNSCNMVHFEIVFRQPCTPAHNLGIVALVQEAEVLVVGLQTDGPTAKSPNG